ncbi:MAG: acetate--CoA ligase family protein [Paracoccaceae bacterium]
MSPDLSRPLCPSSIAVIGGGAWAPAVVAQCLKMGFQGPLWPVHPTRPDMVGVPCLKSLDDLPEAPDAVFIGVNRHLTIDTVARLAAMGAGGAVCFASGFAEAEDDRDAGAALQVQLVEAAGEMPVLGPNCYGFINYLDGALLWPDQHGGVRTDRGVAIVGQSSNILINLTMQRRAVPVAYVVAAGNQAQVGLAEIGRALVEDERVTALGLHIEGVSDVRAFEALAARARELGKPIVALKVGRSEQAQAAAISHTASLAGSDAASRAFLTRLGIPQLDGLDAFLEALKLLHVHGPLPGRRLASLSCSGGEASLVADAVAARRLDLPALDPAGQERVKATLSDLVTVANPLDYHTFIWGDVARMTDTYVAMMASGFDLTCLIYDYPRDDRSDPSAWDCGEEALLAAVARTGSRAAMVATMPEGLPEARANTLLAAGIAPMMGLEAALAAAEAAADLSEAWSRPAAMPVLLGTPVPPFPSSSPEDAECHPARSGKGASMATSVLDEAAAKRLLASHGVPVPVFQVATGSDLATAAAKIGFPLVLKGLGIAHKTEEGAVRLGLGSVAEVEVAGAEMNGVTGFLVESMITGVVAELIVGVVRDPVYGHALTIGAGGVLTELLADSATLLIPACEEDVRTALGSLKVMKLLAGYRAKPAADIDAVVRTVMAVQRFVAAEVGRLEELDINPLICTPDGAVAADALIRFRA